MRRWWMALGLLALASGNEEATLEGCEWIRHFELIAVQRRAVYACVETLIQLSDGGNTGPYLSALRQLYGASAVGQAQALIAQTDRFMGLSAPGLQMDGCAMHQKLLLAYSKVQSMKAQDLRA